MTITPPPPTSSTNHHCSLASAALNKNTTSTHRRRCSPTSATLSSNVSLSTRSADRGFSLIEMLFAVFILAAILTALLGGVLFSVNTLNETKYRANAIAAASACLDEFKKARAAGWVIFCNGTTENNGNLPYREVTCPNAGGAIANGGPTATFNIIGSNGTNAGGVYSARITAEGDCGCLDNNGHVNEQVKIRVQVNWERFRGGNEANVATQFTASKNRTATVEQIFYRYQDEQYISPNACNP